MVVILTCSLKGKENYSFADVGRRRCATLEKRRTDLYHVIKWNVSRYNNLWRASVGNPASELICENRLLRRGMVWFFKPSAQFSRGRLMGVLPACLVSMASRRPPTERSCSTDAHISANVCVLLEFRPVLFPIAEPNKTTEGYNVHLIQQKMIESKARRRLCERHRAPLQQRLSSGITQLLICCHGCCCHRTTELNHPFIHKWMKRTRFWQTSNGRWDFVE